MNPPKVSHVHPWGPSRSGCKPAICLGVFWRSSHMGDLGQGWEAEPTLGCSWCLDSKSLLEENEQPDSTLKTFLKPEMNGTVTEAAFQPQSWLAGRDEPPTKDAWQKKEQALGQDLMRIQCPLSFIKYVAHSKKLSELRRKKKVRNYNVMSLHYKTCKERGKCGCSLVT